jgi:DNA primase
VGLCGSAFTTFQVALLSRYCSTIFFLLDGDNSGKISTERILKIYKTHSLGAYGLNYIPVKLPEGYDPDDFVKKEGKEALNELLVSAREEQETFK